MDASAVSASGAGIRYAPPGVQGGVSWRRPSWMRCNGNCTPQEVMKACILTSFLVQVTLVQYQPGWLCPYTIKNIYDSSYSYDASPWYHLIVTRNTNPLNSMMTKITTLTWHSVLFKCMLASITHPQHILVHSKNERVHAGCLCSRGRHLIRSKPVGLLPLWMPSKVIKLMSTVESLQNQLPGLTLCN